MADFVASHLGGGFSSELDEEKNPSESIQSSGSLVFKKPAPVSRSSFGNLVDEEKKKSYGSFMRMNAYDRHKKFINDYVLRYNHNMDDYLPSTSNYRTDQDVLRQNYKFVREEEDNMDHWEVRMAVKYYNKLFKEYCLADMSRYKEGKVGMRWRTQTEVVSGKGQFICGNKTCNQKDHLKSYEVNFSYVEDGQKKNALVKLRVCPDCAYKLNYKKMKEEKKEKKKMDRLEKKEKKRRKLEGGESQSVQEKDETEEKDEKVEGGGEEDQSQQTKQTQPPLVPTPSPSETWKQKPSLEKTRDEEFDEYFDGLFL